MKPDAFRLKFFEGVPRYQWVETLGRGGVGIVYKAFDVELDEMVAIKVLSPAVEQDEAELLRRFKRELNLNRRIKHPNVARMFDYGLSGDYPYITMEYIEGRDLWALIEEKKRLSPGEAIAILRQVARGSEAVHKLGIVHRDLKSENVLIDKSGGVVIVDFGMARGKPNERFTVDSLVIGTPHYMAPEQVLGKGVDARSDIYAMGIILYEALTGNVPFNAENPIAVAMKHVTEPVPDGLEHVPEVSPELRAIVHKALAKRPEDRFATAAELETSLALLERPSSVVEVVRPVTSAAATVPAAAPEPPARTPSPPQKKGLDHEVDTALDSMTLESAPADAQRVRGASAFREQAEEDEDDGAARPGSDPSRRRPSVLVVNDDVRELLRTATVLCEAGCRTFEVRGAEEALEMLGARAVDLVLMDVDLPGMDGFDVTRVIKARPEHASLPVLLTTGRTDRAQLAFGIQSGAADMLPKPIENDALLASVWKVLQHRGFDRDAARLASEAAK
ncbi:MAG: protein kinase [Acidobacteria bacterium]|nr:protein kinase [Acidobacteriota bacterium]